VVSLDYSKTKMILFDWLYAFTEFMGKGFFALLRGVRGTIFGKLHCLMIAFNVAVVYDPLDMVQIVCTQGDA
jgi:hypothetical protein